MAVSRQFITDSFSPTNDGHGSKSSLTVNMKHVQSQKSEKESN